MTREEERDKLLEEVEAKRKEIYERHKIGSIGAWEQMEIYKQLIDQLTNFVKNEKI